MGYLPFITVYSKLFEGKSAVKARNYEAVLWSLFITKLVAKLPVPNFVDYEKNL